MLLVGGGGKFVNLKIAKLARPRAIEVSLARLNIKILRRAIDI